MRETYVKGYVVFQAIAYFASLTDAQEYLAKLRTDLQSPLGRYSIVEETELLPEPAAVPRSA